VRDVPPVGLLNGLGEAAIDALAEGVDAAPSLGTLAPAPRALLLWLLDLMADVAAHESSNRMSAKNVAIVFAPNLYSVEMPQATDPMAALAMLRKVADCTAGLLAWRIKTRGASSAGRGS